MNIDLYTEYLVKLLRCAILDKKPENMPGEIDPEMFFKFCLYHKVENIAYMSLRNTDTSDIPENVMSLFKEFYMHSISLEATQQYYLDIITEEFEKNDIDYLVLKGRELARLYPSSDMRQSSDLDIYIGRDNAQKAKQIMLDNGFEIEAYSDNNDNHDEYRIDKQILCELHRVLIQNNYAWQEECNKITDRLILNEGSKHCYKMSNEDFYLYNLAHTAKHMKFSGIGIKVFLDLWLILKYYKETLDWDYISEKLEKCKMSEFDKNARKLCEYWFEEKETDDARILKMAKYVALSGWIGTQEQEKSTELAQKAGKSGSVKMAKIRKCADVIFAPYESMTVKYPVLKKHKWLTPLCRIHRGFTAAIYKRDLVKNVTGELDKGNIELGRKITEFKESIGL